jgi:repressor LexA
MVRTSECGRARQPLLQHLNNGTTLHLHHCTGVWYLLGMVDTRTLTAKQELVLSFIAEHIHAHGYPPTIREIGSHLGIKSTNGVNDHLNALSRKGYLSREDGKSRALQLREPGHEGSKTVFQPAANDDDMVEIPLLGRVAAGLPILAEQQHTDTVRVSSFLLGGKHGRGEKVFALTVVGESMIEDGIFDGDYLFVRKQATAHAGEIVVAMIEGEATVKRYHPEGDRIRFQPANAAMKPIYVSKDSFRQTDILGVVVGVYRQV